VANAPHPGGEPASLTSSPTTAPEHQVSSASTPTRPSLPSGSNSYTQSGARRTELWRAPRAKLGSPRLIWRNRGAEPALGAKSFGRARICRVMHGPRGRRSGASARRSSVRPDRGASARLSLVHPEQGASARLSLVHPERGASARPFGAGRLGHITQTDGLSPSDIHPIRPHWLTPHPLQQQETRKTAATKEG
jgi:hypothetical protein